MIRLLGAIPRALALGIGWGILLIFAYSLAVYFGEALQIAINPESAESNPFRGLFDPLIILLAIGITMMMSTRILTIAVLSSLLFAAQFAMLRRPPSNRLAVAIGMSLAGIISLGIHLSKYPLRPLMYNQTVGIPLLIYTASAAPFAVLLSKALFDFKGGIYPIQPGK